MSTLTFERHVTVVRDSIAIIQPGKYTPQEAPEAFAKAIVDVDTF